MKFHNRALPYPILDTTDELRQDFFDGDFQVVVDEVINEDEDRLTLTVLYSCSVHEIEELVRTGKAAYTMLIISPSTMVRRAFTSLSHRQEIDISILDFYGQVELLPQIVVTDRIQGFSSEDLHEEYRDIAFDLFPGDVLAVADSETRTFEFEGLKLEKLITARLNEALDPSVYQIELKESKIYIDMGSTLHEVFSELKQDPMVKPLVFMSIYKDVFLLALQELESDDSAREKRWAPGILKLVEETGLRLDGASLTELNVIAQQILKGDTVERLKKRYLGDRS
jgi:hypothetical protein